MTEPLLCEHCGGQMVPGVPGDVYCPKDECFRASLKEIRMLLKHSDELAKRKKET